MMGRGALLVIVFLGIALGALLLIEPPLLQCWVDPATDLVSCQ